MWMAHLRWKFINRGYYRSTTWVLWPLLAALTPLLPPALRLLNLATAGSMLVFLGAVYSQRPLLEWITGTAASAGSFWLIVLAGLAGCVRDCGTQVTHAVAGLVLMGAVTHAMILGHWYLNQARLPIEPLTQHTWVLFAGIAVSAAIGVATRAQVTEGTVPGGVFAFSGTSYWWVWLLLLGATGGLGAMILATVRERATQSATGLLYIAIVTALGAQFVLNLLILS